jgi:hypothetical protein
MGERGFEPLKAEPTGLQPVPFGRSGTPPRAADCSEATDAIRAAGMRQDLRAAALPPLRPAAFFCAVVPPCFELERELEDPDFLPPRLDEPGEFEILAARSFDMPFLRSPSYCFSFLTPGRLFGMGREYPAFVPRNAAQTGTPGVRPRTYPNRTTV